MEYTAYCINKEVDRELYLCQGKCRDDYKVRCDLDEITVVGNSDEVEHCMKKEGALTVYRAFYVLGHDFSEMYRATDFEFMCWPDGYDYKATDCWYTSQEDACREAVRVFPDKGSHGVVYVRGTLNCHVYEPIEFPVSVFMSYAVNKKTGKESLCARLNAHPEIDGMYATGKVFFPDKSWKDVHFGAAEVTITKEMDTYGFISGANTEQFDVWSDENIDGFVGFLDKQITENCGNPFDAASTLTLAEHPVYGKIAIAVASSSRRYHRTEKFFALFFVTRKTGDFTWYSNESVYNDPATKVIKTLSISQFLKEYIESIHGTEEELTKKANATHSKWFEAYKRSYGSANVSYIADTYSDVFESVEIPGIADIVYDFIDNGLIHVTQMQNTGLLFLSWDVSMFRSLLYFESEEVEEALEEVRRYNKVTDEQLDKMVRAGKLYPTHRSTTYGSGYSHQRPRRSHLTR